MLFIILPFVSLVNCFLKKNYIMGKLVTVHPSTAPGSLSICVTEIKLIIDGAIPDVQVCPIPLAKQKKSCYNYQKYSDPAQPFQNSVHYIRKWFRRAITRYASKYFTYIPTEEELKRELRLDEFQQLDP